MVKHFSRTKKAVRLNTGIQRRGDLKSTYFCSNDDTRMTLDLFMVWSNLCLSCCGSTGRSCMVFADMQKLFLSGERIVAHGPLVFLYYILPRKLIFLFFCFLSGKPFPVQK